MFILQINNIVKQYGTRTVLDIPKFQIYGGDRIGVVGANGAGKSTLLGVLSGEIEPDSGSVDRRFTPVFLHQFASDDSTLSGGEKRKRQILEQVDGDNLILFADEPTANLDGEGIRWVKHKLEAASTLVLVSHDRELLDSLCTRIVEIEDGALVEYTGNFSDYQRAKALKRQKQQEDYQEYRHKKAQLERAVQLKTQRVQRMKRNSAADTSLEASKGKDKLWSRFKKLERQATVVSRRLERLEEVEQPKDLPTLKLDFSLTNPPGNRYVARCDHLDFAWDDKVIFDGAAFQLPRGERVGLCGPNGCGKTTLLHLIHQGDEQIQRAPKLVTGLLNQDFSHIDMEGTVLDNALSRSVQNLDTVRSALAGLLFRRDDVYKKAAVLSGGERMRLSLAMLVLSDCNMLLLDEPTNYLDIPSLEAVKHTLLHYPGTVLLVSHDERFVADCATRRWDIRDRRIVENTGEKTPAAPPNRMLLELRRTQLVQEISGAVPEEKDRLEREYHRVLEQLRDLA